MHRSPLVRLLLASSITVSMLGGAPLRAQFIAPAIPSKHIYSENADARAEIAQAQARALKEHKRVILDFGGNWCGDCQVLDLYFHQQENLSLLERHFILVHVDIGRMDHNVQIADRYGVPVKKGVPALAVIDGRGKVLYSQRTGEFESMRSMNPNAVTEFLNRWKA